MVECVGADQVDRAAKVLREGGLVAFATETVYGLGANALDARAVARVFEVKGRPRFDPLIVHLAEAAEAQRLAARWPEAAQRLAKAFWPGPLTIVVEKHAPGSSVARNPSRLAPQAEGVAIPDLVTAGLPTVALRVPGHELARELIRRAGVPVAAPSANRFGGVSPTRAEHVIEELGEALGEADLVLDGGACQTGLESTVVSVAGARRATVLRLGGVPLERIEHVVGPVQVATGEAAVAQADDAATAAMGLASPGMLQRHYAPRGARLVVVDRLEPHLTAMPEPGRVAALLFAERADMAQYLDSKGFIFETLSPSGDLCEAAANLFAALRTLDASGADWIIAERAPDEGLGRAINDRLHRAAAEP